MRLLCYLPSRVALPKKVRHCLHRVFDPADQHNAQPTYYTIVTKSPFLPDVFGENELPSIRIYLIFCIIAEWNLP